MKNIADVTSVIDTTTSSSSPVANVNSVSESVQGAAHDEQSSEDVNDEESTGDINDEESRAANSLHESVSEKRYVSQSINVRIKQLHCSGSHSYRIK